MKQPGTVQRAFQMVFRVAEVVAPALARRWAVRLFTQPMRFKRPPREVQWIQDATITRHPFVGFYPRPSEKSYFVRYTWGAGPTVLLVHGWAGRGSQLGGMAAPLVAAGYRVVTFDAPAHGDSPGPRTNLVEVGNLIRLLSEEEGGFAAIIGHSFGGMAAGYALSQGARAAKLVTVGSPVTMAYILESFGEQIDASDRTVGHLKSYIERLAQRDVETFSLSHTLADVEIPGLIMHDEDDQDVPCEQAHLLHPHWPGSELSLTQGLGHRRILRDEATIARIVDFVQSDKNGYDAVEREQCNSSVVEPVMQV